MGTNKRQGSTHYRSKRRYEDALQTRNEGEVELNFGNKVVLGEGTAPIATGELAASGIGTFFQITTGDEVDCLFRLPADFDASATSTVHLWYALASSTATSVDTINSIIAYQIPEADANTTGLADAASSEGVANPSQITLGAGFAVGSLYEATGTLSSAFTGAAGGLCHLQVETTTTLDTDKECRLLTKAVFRYAKDYI
jgi:hypothetical protein